MLCSYNAAINLWTYQGQGTWAMFNTMTLRGVQIPWYEALFLSVAPPVITWEGFKVLDIEQLTDPARPGELSGLYVRAEKI
jgi:hypothetical protein